MTASALLSQVSDIDAKQAAVTVEDLHFSYGSSPVLKGINLDIQPNQVTAFIGPSGCGKSTLLRCINRMNDEIPSARVDRGGIRLHGANIYDPDVDVVKLRCEVGMVFQKSNVFPRSIFDNVAFGLRLRGIKKRQVLEERVEHALRQAALWDEVKDRLQDSGYGLSGGQQQRLCIARTMAAQPNVILMDEPCSALDPIATLKVEELLWELRSEYTFIVVTHSMQQASRISDRTAFFYMGELIEYDLTSKMFTNPRETRTEEYISGRFG